MTSFPLRSESGFSLAEVLVAAGLLATALSALAGLFIRSIDTNLTSRYRTSSTILALQKVEELYGSQSGGASGAPLAGVDYLDWSGRTSAAPGAGAVFVRRWWVEPLATNPANAIVIQVDVARSTAGAHLVDRSTMVTLARRRAS